MRESSGGAITVSDDEITDMMAVVASKEGVFVCPEGAATAVALGKFIQNGNISPSEQVLLLNTGSGLKYLDLIQSRI